MKTFKTLSKFAFLALILLNFSCSKSSSSTPATSATGAVTATVGSGTFNSVTANFGYMNSVLTVQGAMADGQSIQMQIIGVTGTGTYTLTGPNNQTAIGGTANYNAAAIINGSSSTAGKSYSSLGCAEGLPTAGFVPVGSIVITQLSSNKMVGTFSFKCAELQNCSDTKMVATGTFTGNF